MCCEITREFNRQDAKTPIQTKISQIGRAGIFVETQRNKFKFYKDATPTALWTGRHVAALKGGRVRALQIRNPNSALEMGGIEHKFPKLFCDGR